MRAARFILIALFLLLLVLPYAQMRLAFVPEKPLAGVTETKKRPSLNFRNWWGGTFQKNYEPWFDANIGFRRSAIRTHNQIGISLFRESFSRSSDRPVFGKSNFVYEDGYIRDFNGFIHPPDAALAETARQLRKLQDALDARRIPFLIIVAPNKANIYPEYIPSDLIVPPETRRPSVFARMKPLLQREGVRLVDGSAILKAEKARSPHLLFPPGGIHWNRLGAALVLKSAWAQLEQQAGRPFVQLDITSVTTDQKPRLIDGETDVAELINAWSVGRGDWNYPRPEFTLRDTGGALLPRVVLVADSFGYIPARILCDTRAIKSLDYYYYFKSHYQARGRLRHTGSMDPDQLDWEKVIFSADAIVLLATESSTPKIGFGFVEHALKRLEPPVQN